jgi:hypothetical protein
MAPRLDWRVGPGDDAAPAVPGPTRVLPARTERRLVLTPLLVALYLLALVCAGGIGYGLGRWSQAHTAIEAEVRRQLALETLAWREADTALLAATLDPEADPGWHAAQVARLLEAGARPDYAAAVEAVSPIGPGLVRVTVRLGPEPHWRSEMRLYRALGTTWYRTPETRQSPNQP